MSMGEIFMDPPSARSPAPERLQAQDGRVVLQRLNDPETGEDHESEQDQERNVEREVAQVGRQPAPNRADRRIGGGVKEGDDRIARIRAHPGDHGARDQDPLIDEQDEIEDGRESRERIRQCQHLFDPSVPVPTSLKSATRLATSARSGPQACAALSPKIAAPTRTMVAPSSIAASKS